MAGDKKLCEMPVIHSDLILYIAFILHKASIPLLFLFTFRIVTFLKFVKRDDILFLKHIQPQSGIAFCFLNMDICIKKLLLLQLSRTVFKYKCNRFFY